MKAEQPAAGRPAAAELKGVCAVCGGPRREEYERCWKCFREAAGICVECGGVCGPGREVCRRCYMQRNNLSECPRCNRVKPARFLLCYSCQFGARPGGGPAAADSSAGDYGAAWAGG